MTDQAAFNLQELLITQPVLKLSSRSDISEGRYVSTNVPQSLQSSLETKPWLQDIQMEQMGPGPVIHGPTGQFYREESGSSVV